MGLVRGPENWRLDLRLSQMKVRIPNRGRHFGTWKTYEKFRELSWENYKLPLMEATDAFTTIETSTRFFMGEIPVVLDRGLECIFSVRKQTSNDIHGGQKSSMI